MPVGWRIVKRKYTQVAFSGEGARRFGGRWNSGGSAIVYVAGCASGALLEILVHGREELVPYYHLYRVDIPEDVTIVIAANDLPDNWRDSPAPPDLARIGDEWIARQTAVALSVPSAVMPVDTNYLLNPTHPDFGEITIDGPIEYAMDDRL